MTTPTPTRAEIEAALEEVDAAAFPTYRHTLVSELIPHLRTLAAAYRAMEAERDGWKSACRAVGVCMSCALGHAADPYGCTDCLNTGWDGGEPAALAAAFGLADNAGPFSMYDGWVPTNYREACSVLAEELRKALATPAAPGWRLVPVEPTEAMWIAHIKPTPYGEQSDGVWQAGEQSYEAFCRTYRAMLAAHLDAAKEGK